MNLKILGTSVTYYTQYDLSEIVSSPVWYTSMDSQPGKFSFSITEDKAVFYRSGDIIEAFADDKQFFKGKIFIRRKQKDGLWKIVAYDNLRYLQNEDTIVFGASTASERFKKICEIQGLSYKISQASSYKCAGVIEDAKTYFSMLSDALDETRTATTYRYFVYDDSGTLKFADVDYLMTNLLLGDESLITDYSYESSIDEAYNSIKVIREDEKTKSRQVFTATSDKTIAVWGKLQKVEKATDADMNANQLQKQANDALKQNNAEATSLSLESIGNMAIRAGNSFTLLLSDLKREWGKDTRKVLVRSCTHTFSPVHTQSMEVEVIG
ncbi:XkdQ/YqbQ family protein [Enterococcus timonensis]|uniref:XkdQ/YqbQ family protein n=1 Tax=Enterococcus timonensis TaxID=1852364 RepID=UPI0008DA1BAC|nr:hypothetical protein [Enterococcus timonensis]